MALKNFDFANDGTQARNFSGNVQSKLLAADVAETITVPTSPQQANRVIFASTADFFIQSFEDAAANIVENSTFTDATGLTLGTGWSVAAGVASSDGSQAGDSDLEQTPTIIPAIAGQAYLVSFEVTAYTAGNVTPVAGGTEGTDRGSAAVFSEVIVAGSDGKITLRADADFVGSVDDLTATPVAAVPVDNTTGAAPELIKANCDETSRSFICTNSTEFSIVASGAATVTASFFHI